MGSTSRSESGGNGGGRSWVYVLGAAAAAVIGGASCFFYVMSTREKGNTKILEMVKNFGKGGVASRSDRAVTRPAQCKPVRVPIPPEVKEPTSYANLQECVVKHLSLHLEADFERSVLRGRVALTAETRKDGVEELVLDTRNLSIKSVRIHENEMKYELGEHHEGFGRAMRISLPQDLRRNGSSFNVQIEYETAPGSQCSALQWLSASQTAGKKHPYLFSQCQAIHCRSMIPCQDAPCVKVSYDATVKVPSPLVALMSAISVGNEKDGGEEGKWLYHFRQEIPIPCYLIALAVGDLEYRDIGPRSRVWSEPSVVDAGAYEFADTEKFLSAAEQLCGPYVWGRYDLLLLPPSFPYGGMENPCLTFVTPTLLAGDRSLANVVAHEIAHSWMGNLVTNGTWEDFWMNEGFTVFVERKIIARMFGEPAAALKATMGWQHLENAVELFGENHEFTKLHITMDGVDPDDSFSSVPYEKGCAFLVYLEQLFGGPSVFEPFIRAHVQRFQFGVVSLESWKPFVLDYFKDMPEQLNQIEWQKWTLDPGMPPVKPQVDTSLIDSATEAAKEWATTGTSRSTNHETWNSDQKVIFIEHLISLHLDNATETKLDSKVFAEIDEKYKFSQTNNSEILFRWCTLGIKVGDESVYEMTTDLVKKQGRMKFVRPLYRDLYNSGSKGQALAVETFRENMESYHAIAQKMIARDLKLDGDI